MSCEANTIFLENEFDKALNIWFKDGESALAKHMGLTDDEFNQDINEHAFFACASADDDRSDIIEHLIEDYVEHKLEQVSH